MIAGAGFAMMAWELAQLRTYRTWISCPPPRHAVDMRRKGNPVVEYYRILDEAMAGFEIGVGTAFTTVHLYLEAT